MERIWKFCFLLSWLTLPHCFLAFSGILKKSPWRCSKLIWHSRINWIWLLKFQRGVVKKMYICIYIYMLLRTYIYSYTHIHIYLFISSWFSETLTDLRKVRNSWTNPDFMEWNVRVCLGCSCSTGEVPTLPTKSTKKEPEKNSPPKKSKEMHGNTHTHKPSTLFNSWGSICLFSFVLVFACVYVCFTTFLRLNLQPPSATSLPVKTWFLVPWVQTCVPWPKRPLFTDGQSVPTTIRYMRTPSMWKIRTTKPHWIRSVTLHGLSLQKIRCGKGTRKKWCVWFGDLSFPRIGIIHCDGRFSRSLLAQDLISWKKYWCFEWSSAAEVIVTPNSDTPYSFAWLDLRVEPVVIQVPAMERPGVQIIV